MNILLATTNQHKIKETAKIIPSAIASIISLIDLGLQDSIEPPDENQDTFEGNAALKAYYYAQQTGKLTLADDSGLEVDALDGKPGVHSARYSGTTGTREQIDIANNKLLLMNMEGVDKQKRTAGFVCAMALCKPGEQEPIATSKGSINGRIICINEACDTSQPEKGCGENGFGYDPLFFLPDYGCTSAELSFEQKNKISHRGAAAREMAKLIENANL